MHLYKDIDSAAEREEKKRKMEATRTQFATRKSFDDVLLDLADFDVSQVA